MEAQEEFKALIEALETGPNPSSFQEVTGARIDFFSELKGIESFDGYNPQSELRFLGYVGALTFVTIVTSDDLLPQPAKLAILQAGADHIDRDERGYGKKDILTIIRGTERLRNRLDLHDKNIPGWDAGPGQIYETYVQARRHIPRKPISQRFREFSEDIIGRHSSSFAVEEIDEMVSLITAAYQEMNIVRSKAETI